MAKKRTVQATQPSKQMDITPLVAASLAGIIYQARLFNRQARMNIPESSVVTEVLDLWQTVHAALDERES